MNIFNDPTLLVQKTQLVDRLLRYVRIDTTSDSASNQCPSTQGQLNFARLLVKELLQLGINDASVDENGYVTATLKGNSGDCTIGLIAHMDTSDAASGKNITPIIHKDYDGTPIVLKNNVVIDPDKISALQKCIGHTIITSDGSTLLGADNKAGIAIIMSALEYLQDNPSILHPTIRVGFTPDEEIGRGHEKFPIETFAADTAFTIDGSFLGEINIETFEGYSMDVDIEGIPTHPGTGKNTLVNALRHMALFVDRLPKHISPECTENRDGFIHPVSITGDAGKCRCQLIVRDFDSQKAKELCLMVEEQAYALRKEEPRLSICVTTTFSYPNMGTYISQKPEIKDKLEAAVQMAGVVPQLVPIRGGTDGSNLSRKGLPTPNIFTGAMNFHGPTEWTSVQNMGYSLCTILNLMTLYSKRHTAHDR